MMWFILLKCIHKYDVTDLNLVSKIKALSEISQTSDLYRSFFRPENPMMPTFPKKYGDVFEKNT